MARTIRVVLLVCTSVLIALGVVACGVAAAGQGTTITLTPAAQGTLVRSATAVRSTPAPSPTAHITPGGAVTVAVGAAQYGTTETIRVVINNGTGAVIAAPNHQTSCRDVSLQRYVNGVWQAQRPCPLLSPSGFVPVAAGATSVPLAPGSSPWLSGTYRIAFIYVVGTDAAAKSGSSDQLATSAPVVYSASFTVG